MYNLKTNSVKHNPLLVIMSLLSILLMTFHMTDDIARGMVEAGPSNLIVVPILVAWLCGTLLFAGRRSGYIIIIIGSLLGLLVPVLHMKGVRFAEIAQSGGGFFFVWTLIALGITSLFSIILSILGLWNMKRSSSQLP
jgi:hypothetical protein